MLAQIDAKHFCAGIILKDEKVVEAAPIVKYMIGWNRDKVRSYCKSKEWKVAIVKSMS